MQETNIVLAVLFFLFQYLLYLGRWQLSSPILGWAIKKYKNLSPTKQAVIANFWGGLLFFWLDLALFNLKDIVNFILTKTPLW